MSQDFLPVLTAALAIPDYRKRGEMAGFTIARLKHVVGLREQQILLSSTNGRKIRILHLRIIDWSSSSLRQSHWIPWDSEAEAFDSESSLPKRAPALLRP